MLNFFKSMFNASRIPTGRCSLGDDCKAPPNAELRQRYKCMHCGVQLHQPPFGCSVYFGEEEDALITCLPDKAFINCPLGIVDQLHQHRQKPQTHQHRQKPQTHQLRQNHQRTNTVQNRTFESLSIKVQKTIVE